MLYKKQKKTTIEKIGSSTESKEIRQQVYAKSQLRYILGKTEKTQMGLISGKQRNHFLRQKLKQSWRDYFHEHFATVVSHIGINDPLPDELY